MTIDIAESRRILEAAAEGPWECGRHPAMAKGAIIKPIHFGDRTMKLPECEGGHLVMWNKADAAFIAHARNTYAELLDAAEELERLRKAVEKSRWDAYHLAGALTGEAKKMMEATVIRLDTILNPEDKSDGQ